MESKIHIDDSDKEILLSKKVETSRKLLWVEIGHLSELWQFFICTFVVFFFFIPYGYLQVIFKLLICLVLIFYGLIFFSGINICY